MFVDFFFLCRLIGLVADRGGSDFLSGLEVKFCIVLGLTDGSARVIRKKEGKGTVSGGDVLFREIL